MKNKLFNKNECLGTYFFEINILDIKIIYVLKASRKIKFKMCILHFRAEKQIDICE